MSQALLRQVISNALSVRLKAIADDLADLPELVRLAEKLEPALRKRFLQVVASTQDKVELEKLASAVLSGNLHAIEAAAKIKEFDTLADLLKPVLIQGFIVGATFALEDLELIGIGMSFDLINPLSVRWAETTAAKLVVQVIDSQKDAIAEIVRQAVSGDFDVRETAKRIKELIGLDRARSIRVLKFRDRLQQEGLSDEVIERRTLKYYQAQLKDRSLTIARTEIINAHNAGQQDLWNANIKNGLLSKEDFWKGWIVTDDDRLDLKICFPAKTPILTLTGWKQISKVKPGEFVLTHEDRFKRVSHTASHLHDGMTVKMQFKKAGIGATATYGHLILTQRGWIKAEDLSIDDMIAVNGIPCALCHVVVPCGYRKQKHYCRLCQAIIRNKERWKDPAAHKALRDLNDIRWSDPLEREKAALRMTLANPSKQPEAKEKIRQVQLQRINEGTHHLMTKEARKAASIRMKAMGSDPEIHKKASATRKMNGYDEAYVQAYMDKTVDMRKNASERLRLQWSRKSKDEQAKQIRGMLAGNSRAANGSKSELLLAEWLTSQGIAFESQWPFSYLENEIERHGFADFFLPGPNMIIECDGYFHFKPESLLRDQCRDKSLQKQGIKVLRISSKDITRKLHAIGSQIRAHCCLTWMKPKNLIHAKITHQPVYDLTVEDDHSFIAGGIVAHNCEPLDGARVEIDEPFQSSIGPIMHPGAHPRCRCAMGLFRKKAQ